MAWRRAGGTDIWTNNGLVYCLVYASGALEGLIYIKNASKTIARSLIKQSVVGVALIESTHRFRSSTILRCYSSIEIPELSWPCLYWHRLRRQNRHHVNSRISLPRGKSLNYPLWRIMIFLHSETNAKRFSVSDMIFCISTFSLTFCNTQQLGVWS